MSGTSGGRFTGRGRGRYLGRGSLRPHPSYSNPRSHHRTEDYGHYGPDRGYDGHHSPPPRGRDWQPRSERGRSGSDSWDRTDDRPYDDRYDDRYRGEQDYQHLDRYNDNTDYSRHPSDGFSDDGFRSPARRHTSYRIPSKSAQSSPVTTSNKYSILDLDEQVRQGRLAAAKLAELSKQQAATGGM
jgi:hypothetical protein